MRLPVLQPAHPHESPASVKGGRLAYRITRNFVV